MTRLYCGVKNFEFCCITLLQNGNMCYATVYYFCHVTKKKQGLVKDFRSISKFLGTFIQVVKLRWLIPGSLTTVRRRQLSSEGCRDENRREVGRADLSLQRGVMPQRQCGITGVEEGRQASSRQGTPTSGDRDHNLRGLQSGP